MENRSFTFRALLLGCAAAAALAGAMSLLGDDGPSKTPPARLTAAQRAELQQPAPEQAAPERRRAGLGGGDREPGDAPVFDGEEPLDGSGS